MPVLAELVDYPPHDRMPCLVIYGGTVQNTFGAGTLNPALLPNPRDALFIAQLSNLVLRRVEVRKLSRASAHSRSQISTGKGLSSSRVRAGAASTG